MKFFIFLIICILGCAPSKVFVKAVDNYSTVILPEYKEYIARDTGLSTDTKRIRIQTAVKFQQLITEELNKK